MKKFVLAITTFNRLAYLKDCIQSFDETKSTKHQWTIIVADDGSNDGTIDYLKKLELRHTEIKLIQNIRIGVHQQTNTIFKELESTSFDCCFKIDDDITFLKSGWDEIYFQTALETGCHHLVYCDEEWSKEQLLQQFVTRGKLVGKIPALQVNGIFFTITPQVLKAVGYFDVGSFGFRGMGHVDYTVRCARAGFTDKDTPWDIKDSNTYLSAVKRNYNSVLSSSAISTYDSFFREKKAEIIRQKHRVYIPLQKLNTTIFSRFKEELIESLSAKVEQFETEKADLVEWYEREIAKIKDWYANQNQHLPNWYLKAGRVFKLFKK